MSLSGWLQAQEPAFDAACSMLGRSWSGSGYHSRLAPGTWVHETRASLAYAVALLASREPDHVRRAHDVFAAVLALQETDPTAATYGIWAYTLEEPLSQMAPPDWNWADFCGAQIALALHDHAPLLEPELTAALRQALGHAAWSIFRRNVQPGYTNIAVMGGGVTAAAGELLGEPRLLDYGRRRLERFREHTEWHGGLNEYNSPTYTMVALHEAERILHLCADVGVREAASRIHRFCWESLAAFWHPGTGQLCGPHSRAYSDRLSDQTAAELARRRGIELPDDPSSPPEPVPPVPCPPDLATRFHELTTDVATVRQRFIRRDADSSSTWGTAWLTHEACLGSVSGDTTWTQRRPVLGYWVAEAGPPVVLRARLLHDGRDFASGLLRCAQSGPRVLMLLSLLPDKGDWHDHLDRPADGAFGISSLLFQVEIAGEDAVADDLGDGLFALRAGGWQALVRCGAARFDGRPVPWRLHAEPGRRAVQAVMLEAPSTRVRLAALSTTFVVVGVELAPVEDPPRVPAIELVQTEDRIEAQWPAGGLVLEAPARPGA